MCTSDLCNDNDYQLPNERPTRLQRKQIGQAQELISTVVEGEIDHNLSVLDRAASTSDSSSRKNSSTILSLFPIPSTNTTNTSFPSLSLPNSSFHPLSNHSKPLIIETISVDTSVKDLGMTNDLHNSGAETPREDAFLETVRDEEDELLEDLAFPSLNVDADDIQSLMPKHRIPRQARPQGEQTHI